MELPLAQIGAQGKCEVGERGWGRYQDPPTMIPALSPLALAPTLGPRAGRAGWQVAHNPCYSSGAPGPRSPEDKDDRVC